MALMREPRIYGIVLPGHFGPVPIGIQMEEDEEFCIVFNPNGHNAMRVWPDGTFTSEDLDEVEGVKLMAGTVAVSAATAAGLHFDPNVYEFLRVINEQPNKGRG